MSHAMSHVGLMTCDTTKNKANTRPAWRTDPNSRHHVGVQRTPGPCDAERQVYQGRALGPRLVCGWEARSQEVPEVLMVPGSVWKSRSRPRPHCPPQSPACLVTGGTGSTPSAPELCQTPRVAESPGNRQDLLDGPSPHGKATSRPLSPGRASGERDEDASRPPVHWLASVRAGAWPGETKCRKMMW